MSFGQAVSAFFKNYATFSGRTQRSGYWWVVLFAVILSVGLFFLDLAFFSAVWPQELLAQGLGPLSIVMILGLLLPSLSLGVRRLHDTGRSGWWLLLPVAPGILQTIVFADQPPEAALTSPLGIVLGLAVLAASIVLLVFYVKDSQPGDNQYGPNPKGVQA